MAVRTPLYINGGDLQEMTTAQINVLKDAAIFWHAGNVGTSLAVVSSGGNLTSITDNRLIAGAAMTHVSRYPTVADDSLEQAYSIPITYQRVDQSAQQGTVQADTNNIANFCYYDGSDVVAMTNTDMYDTIFSPAIDMLVDGTDRDGTYRVGTTNSISGMTLISSTPIYTDTRADTSAYQAASIAETQDQPTTITNYYLHGVTQGYGGTPSVTLPAQIISGGDIQTFGSAAFGTYMELNMKYWVGEKVRYSINGTGNNKGSGMVDTRLSGSNYQTRFVNTDDYRAQEFPGGSSGTVATHYLKIRRI